MAAKRPREPRHIQSISVGFRLIRCLESAAGPLSLKELSAGAAMSPSQAHLYMASFVKAGFVQQDPATARYNFGRYAVELGLAALRRLDVIAVAREPMRELQQRTGESVFLTIWGNRGPTIVHKVDSARPIPMTVRLGHVLPLLLTSSGRIFLAHLPATDTADLVGAEKRMYRELLQSGKLSAKRIALILDNVRQRGLSRTDSLFDQGFTGLSAPVLDYSGRICAAMTLIGPSGLFDTAFDGKPATALKASTVMVSNELGYGLAEFSPAKK